MGCCDPLRRQVIWIADSKGFANLFPEADVFMAERSVGDIARNELVSSKQYDANVYLPILIHRQSSSASSNTSKASSS